MYSDNVTSEWVSKCPNLLLPYDLTYRRWVFCHNSGSVIRHCIEFFTLKIDIFLCRLSPCDILMFVFQFLNVCLFTRSTQVSYFLTELIDTITNFCYSSKEFILSTDSSSDNDNKEHDIAYGGRSLRGAEFKWDVSKRECLA